MVNLKVSCNIYSNNNKRLFQFLSNTVSLLLVTVLVFGCSSDSGGNSGGGSALADDDDDIIIGSADDDDGDDDDDNDADDDDSELIDFDGDGYAATVDCDDGDHSVHTMLTGYPDSDEDGYSATGVPVQVCSGDALPSGYLASVSDIPDCDDSDAAIHTELSGYPDRDLDGYTFGDPTTVCTDGILPPGYLYSESPTTDCDDTDINNWLACDDCIDSDGDLYYTGCDDYATISGPDCDDEDNTNNDGCVNTGVMLEIDALALDTCGSWTPTYQPGVTYRTPAEIKAGVMAIGLLKSHKDEQPADIRLDQPIVEVNLSDGGRVAISDVGFVAEGTYTHIRIKVAYSNYEVDADSHSGMTVPGILHFDFALSSYQAADSSIRTQGDYDITFTASGNSFTNSGTTYFNCLISAWGGIAKTADNKFEIDVPLPDGPLVIDHQSPLPVQIDLQFPMRDTFGWIDLAESDFTDGVFDVAPLPLESEQQDGFMECNFFMVDRCMSDIIVPIHPTWPMTDSQIDFCTYSTHISTTCQAEGEEGYGQDKHYQVNYPDYTSAADTVFDEVTGLMWQRNAPDIAVDWWEAREYCNELVLAGYTDWRLPSRIELVSTIDFGFFDPVIDEVIFPETSNEYYWSSSPVPFLNMAYGVRYELGFIYDHDPYSSQRARCVRADYTPPSPRFVFDDDTVTDMGTGLIWQRHPFSNGMDWMDALDACETMVLGGYDDWRLPTLKEQQTIVDERRLQPCIDFVAFPDTLSAWFWSSTPIPTHPDEAWCTSYTDGYASIHQFIELFQVRCVR
jgi:Protein of unknown function (DUF1566)